jgi:hypothetical protein
MAKSKVESAKNVQFAEGGDTHMFGPQKAGKQKPADTAHDVTDSGGKFATGGGGKMFGYAGSQTAKAGITSAR